MERYRGVVNLRMVLVLDGAKIKEKDYNEKAMLIEKKEKCSLSSAFSMV